MLFGIDLAVAPGEIVGVLGRNGMGKTTLVRTIMGLLRAERRHDRASPAATIAGWRAEPDRARRRRASCPKAARCFANLSVDEHLSAFRARVARRQRRLDAGARARALSGAGGAPLARRQPALGRRAADARDRPRPRHQPAAADPRRGDRRAGAAGARGDLARAARSCATPAWR